MNGFDANYISLDTIKDHQPARETHTSEPYTCPICDTDLDQAKEESIAPDVLVYKCATGHGYYFPEGEFTKFKQGQTSKITYFKLWQVPFGSPVTTLLTTIFGLILSAGLVIGVISTQTEQVITTQATDIILSERAYVQSHAVTFIANTREQASVNVHIPALNNYDRPLDTQNGTAHVQRILDIPSGTYKYYFTIISNGKINTSSTYTFTIP